MREIKFEYILLEDNKFIDKAILTLEDIEQLDSNEFCYEVLRKTEKVIKRQFTGLKDKNDVEVYEGDIFKIEIDWGYGLSEIIAEVYFKDGCFRAKALNSNEDTLLIECPNIEIIGNVYNN